MPIETLQQYADDIVECLIRPLVNTINMDVGESGDRLMSLLQQKRGDANANHND